MKPDTFGNRFKITTFGESHSKAVGVLIEGIKPNLRMDIKDIQKLLDARKPKSKLTTKRKEDDELVILSGIFEGKTLGSPIAAIVYNKDARSKDYENLKDVFRPSHADYAFFKKYGIRDYRGGGRSSGRETVSRVIAGAVAMDFLKKKNIKIESKIIRIGKFVTEKWDETKKELPFADKNQIKDIEHFIKNLNGDSIGGIIETRIYNVKEGVGEPVFEKLDANLAKAVMSIGAVKGIEFGDGFALTCKKGSEVNDEMNKEGFLSNHSGGIQGGISNGEVIVFRTAVKPTPSIAKKQKSVNVYGEEVELTISGRHDPCIAIRIIPVIDSMVAITLANLIEANECLKEKKDKSLEDLREDIKEIDREIFFLLSERFEIVKKIAKLKKMKNMKIEDKNIETELIKNIKKFKFKFLNDDFIKKIYDIVFDYSKKLQK